MNMERVSIFKPCTIEYPQYDKPVKYTEEFLKGIANSTYWCPIVDGHYGKSIGEISNITFTDGELFVDTNSSESLQKFSPSFDGLTLVEEEDCFVAVEGKLVEVASTVKPRLDNSKGGSEMGEETIEFFQKEVKRLQEENNKLEFKAKQDKKKIESFKEKETQLEEIEKELDKLRKENEENSKIIKEQKPIVDAYKAEQEKVHEELLEQASKGNEQFKEQLKNCDNDTLKAIAEIHTEEVPAEGVGADNAPGLGEGDGSDGDEETKQAEELEEVKAMFGELTNKEE